MDEFRARAWEKRRKKKTTNNHHHHHHHHRDKKRRRKTALYTLVNQTTKRNAREKILWIWELKHERKNCHHHWEREECFCSWLSNNSKKKDIFIILWCANDIREIEYKEEEKKKQKKKKDNSFFWEEFLFTATRREIRSELFAGKVSQKKESKKKEHLRIQTAGHLTTVHKLLPGSHHSMSAKAKLHCPLNYYYLLAQIVPALLLINSHRVRMFAYTACESSFRKVLQHVDYYHHRQLGSIWLYEPEHL